MSDNLIKYLNESLGSKKISQGSFTNISGIFDTVTSLIPQHLLTEFDYVSIGDIPDFAERQINALTRDGVIYITSDQDDSADAIDDIIHEISHTLEAAYGYEIYADGKLEKEFL